MHVLPTSNSNLDTPRIDNGEDGKMESGQVYLRIQQVKELMISFVNN